MDAPLVLLVSDTLINMMPFAGILLILLWMMMRWRSRRRDIANYQSPIERAERYQQERGMRQDLESLMVEIEQLARRFSTQLDAKSMQLEKLMREADEKIAKLEGLPKPTSQDPPPAAPVEDELTRNVYRLADAGHDAGAIAQQLGEHVGKVELILALRR